MHKHFDSDKRIRKRLVALSLGLCLALPMTACEGDGPGDEVWQPETAKQSTIGLPKPTLPVSPTVSTTESKTEASAPVASENDPTVSSSAVDISVADTTAEVVTTQAPTTEPGPTIEVIDTDYECRSELTEEMFDAATTRLGSYNTYRMGQVIKKAQAGEPVTIVMVGQTALTGEGANYPVNSSENLLREYWKEVFPASELRIFRDVAGANDPYFAIHRAAMFVALMPDLVMIDYSSVDDGSDEMQRYIENLMHRYLNCDSQPAVLFLSFATVETTDDKDNQRIISTRYRLPELMFGDAIKVALESEVFSDRTEVISTDHFLTDAGHGIFAATLERYLNNVRAAVRSDKINTSYVIPASPIDAAQYSGSHIADNETVRPSAKAGIAKGSSVSQDYPNGWTANAPGFEVTFKVTARNFGILYRAVPDPAGAEVDVFLDGVYWKTFSCADMTLSAPCDRSIELFAADSKAHHVVTIRQKAGTAGSFFALLALLVS